MEPWKKKLSSRKFLFTIGVVALTFVNEALGLGIDEESLISVAVAVSAFILGESALDRERIKADQQVAVQNLKAQAEQAIQFLQGELEAAKAAIEEMTADEGPEG